MQTLDLVFVFFVMRNCLFCRIVQWSIILITKYIRCEVKTVDLVFVVRKYLLLITKCRRCEVKTLDLVDVFLSWEIVSFVELCSEQFYKSHDADAAKKSVCILLEKRCPCMGIEPGIWQFHTHALTNYTKDHHWNSGANIYYIMRMLARITSTPHEPTTQTWHHYRATL